MIRIFTTAKSRQAPADTLTAFDANIQAFHKVTKISDEIGGVKVADLPGPEALLNSGNRDGQTKMVRVRDRVRFNFPENNYILNFNIFLRWNFILGLKMKENGRK